ncbi:phage tail protein [Sphingobacterium sp. MYb382]|uniref:phage tail protein n=1 Tax=Sphingobacterium sp. MYb382 TaxID=2745278 RepID=UPI00309CB39C
MDNNNRRDFLKHSGLLLGSLMLSGSVLGKGAEGTNFGGFEPYLGEIGIFPYDFIPRGWAACNGQIMAIRTNQALFALLGTMYGGDGMNTFALPDLRGRVPIGVDSNSYNYVQGQQAGTEFHSLLVSEIPWHNHETSNIEIKKHVGGQANQTTPKNAIPGNNATYANRFSSDYDEEMELIFDSNSSITGGNIPHPNMQPFLALQFCIAVTGDYPPRD